MFPQKNLAHKGLKHKEYVLIVWVRTGSGNGLALNKWQAITWTINVQDLWCFVH